MNGALWRKRGALLVGAMLAATVLGEVGLRVLAPVEYRDPAAVAPDEEGWTELIHRPCDLEDLPYELVPDVEQRGRGSLVRTNHHGMRDLEPLPDDTPGLVRIAAVGDSFTFGLGVAGKDAYPNALQKLLNEQRQGTRPVFDVLNFGVSGYNTREEAAVVRHKVMQWRPRLILLGYYFNDPETSALSPLQVHFFPVEWWQHSHLLRLLHREWFRRQTDQLGGGDYLRFLHEEPSRWQSVLDGFTAITTTARQADVPVLLVLFPDTPPVSWQTYRYADLHGKVAAAARERGMDVLDLLEVFRARPPASLCVVPGDPHPSVDAHRRAAQAILEKIRQDHPELLEPTDG